MGFWKDVSLDMQMGMSKERAIKLNSELRYGNLTTEEKQRKIAEAEADIKLNSMP